MFPHCTGVPMGLEAVRCRCSLCIHFFNITGGKKGGREGGREEKRKGGKEVQYKRKRRQDQVFIS